MCARWRKRISRRRQSSRRGSAIGYPVRLADAELLDDARDVGGGYVVEGVLVFLFQALAEIFGTDVTGFAIAEVASGAALKFDKTGMSQAEHDVAAVHEEFAIHGVGVAGGDAIPTVREAAAIDVVGYFGGNVEGADEITHRADVRNPRCFRHGHKLFRQCFPVPFCAYLRAPATAFCPAC